MKKLLMALALLPLMAAAETETIGDITWSYSISDGKAVVEGADPRSGSIVIPSTLGGSPVTSIGVNIFYGCNDLMSVTIPASVQNLGKRGYGDCFHGCPSLVSIVVDPMNSVYSSVDGVLYNKSKSEVLTCPEGKVGTITIPASVTKIDAGGTFSGCTELTAVNVAQG